MPRVVIRALESCVLGVPYTHPHAPDQHTSTKTQHTTPVETQKQGLHVVDQGHSTATQIPHLKVIVLFLLSSGFVGKNSPFYTRDEESADVSRVLRKEHIGTSHTSHGKDK